MRKDTRTYEQYLADEAAREKNIYDSTVRMYIEAVETGSWTLARLKARAEAKYVGCEYCGATHWWDWQVNTNAATEALSRLQEYPDLNTAAKALAGQVIVWRVNQPRYLYDKVYWKAERNGTSLGFGNRDDLLKAHPEAIVLTPRPGGIVIARRPAQPTD